MFVMFQDKKKKSQLTLTKFNLSQERSLAAKNLSVINIIAIKRVLNKNALPLVAIMSVLDSVDGV